MALGLQHAGSPRPIRIIVFVLCLALAIWDGLSGIPDPGNVHETLQQNFARSLKTFAVLSGIKASLAVIEGSEVGVGFGVQLGDVAQSAYDLVDAAWYAVLVGGACLMGLDLILGAVQTWDVVLMWMLAILLALQIAWNLFASTHEPLVLRRARQLLVTLVVAVYLVPLAAAGGLHLAESVTAAPRDDAAARLGLLDTQLEYRIGAQKDLGLWGAVKDIGSSVQRGWQYLREKAQDVAVWAVTLLVSYVLECIVFPVAMIWAMVGVVRRLTDQSLATTRQIAGAVHTEEQK